MPQYEEGASGMMPFCETVLEGHAAPEPGQTRSWWRRRRAEAVVQQSFIVRMDCTRFFRCKMEHDPKIFTEQKRFQERSQLKLGHLPAFSQERPQTGRIPIHIFLPRRAKFELSRAISLQRHMKCSNAQRSRQMLMTNRPEQHTAHAAKKNSFVGKQLQVYFGGWGKEKEKWSR